MGFRVYGLRPRRFRGLGFRALWTYVGIEKLLSSGFEVAHAFLGFNMAFLRAEFRVQWSSYGVPEGFDGL